MTECALDSRDPVREIVSAGAVGSDRVSAPSGAMVRSWPCREKTILEPSGDQAGNESSSFGFRVKLRCCEPSVRITHTSSSPNASWS